jgi:uncharacterized membrane protein YhaH (DUF805 family)
MKVDFLTAIQRGFKGFVDFRGAATRSEYWYWTLFTLLLGLVLSVVEGIIWPPEPTGETFGELLVALSTQVTPLTTPATILLFLPNLAITARRFHDAGFSAKWLFLLLLPLAVAFAGAVTLAEMGITPEYLPYEALAPIVILLGLILLLIVGISIFYLIICVLPSRLASAGNKYVRPEWESAADTGTTA